MVVNKEQLEALPEQVLQYHTGYVTRYRPDTTLVVKGSREVLQNGVKTRVAFTERLMDRIDDTDKLVLQLNEEAKRLNTGVTYEKAFVRKEVASGTDIGNQLDMNNFGGAITGPRSTREMKFGIEGVTPTRTSAIESMEGMINNVARGASINEYKLQMIQKFTNTFGDVLEDAGNWTSPVKAGAVTSDQRSNIEFLQRWMKSQFSMQTTDQRLYNSVTQNIAAWVEGVSWLNKSSVAKKFHRGLLSSTADTPFMYARSSAFHSLLGFWNPAQLLVQATGASIAFAINPTRFPKNMSRVAAFRTAMMSLEAGNIKGFDILASRVHKLAGFENPEQFKAVAKGLHNTGLMQSLRSNADYNAAVKGLHLDNGALRRVWDSKLMFFREGEGFTRLYGWSNALEDWMVANKGGKFTQEVADEITRNSLKYTLNLNSSNKAVWQEGVLSIPTQFMQITTKYLEALTGKTLTGMEKTKMLANQVLIFGAAGIPVYGDEMARFAAEAFYGDANQLTKEDKAKISGGLMGWLSNEVTGWGGLDMSRFSISSGLEDMLVNLMTESEVGIDTLFGAAGTVPVRAFEAMSYAATMTPSAVYNFDTNASLKIIDKFLDITSTWSNASKAKVWYNMQQVRDKNGNLLFNIDKEEDIAAIIARGIGFSTLRETDLWNTGKFLYEKAQHEKDAVNALSRLHADFYQEIRDGEDIETYRGTTTAILQQFTPAEKARIMKSVYRRMYSGETKEAQQFKKVMKAIVEGNALEGRGLFGQSAPIGVQVLEENE